MTEQNTKVSYSETIYQQLVENMNEAVCVSDAQERTVYANPKFCALMEMSLDEVMNKESYDFLDAESAKTVKQTNESKRKQGISSSYLGNLQSKSGKLIPVLLNGTPLPNGGTIGIMTDLRQLQEQESIYRQLVENMNEAVWMGNAQEQTVYANPKFCELMEMSLDEMVGRESYEFWDAESAKTVKQTNESKRKQGISSSYLGNLQSKSGKLIPVLLNGTPLPNGGTIGIMTDLRQLRQKEEEGRILSHAVQNSVDAIFLVDKISIRSWNKWGRLIFGYKESEVLGGNPSILFSEETQDSIFLTTERIRTQEIAAVHKNGSTITLAATVSNLTTTTDTSLRLIIARDITDHRRIEEELLLKYQKLRDVYKEYGILRRKVDYMNDLLLFVKKTNPSLERFGDFIVNSLVMLTGADACMFRSITSDGKYLAWVSVFGLEDWRGEKPAQIENSLAQKAYHAGTPLRILNLFDEPRYQSKQLARKNNLSSLLLIPLGSYGELIGSINLYIKHQSQLEVFENDFIELYALEIEVMLKAFFVRKA